MPSRSGGDLVRAELIVKPRSVRRVAALAFAAALVAAPLSPATAGKKKPKPVQTKLFFHGSMPFGEVEAETNGIFLPMTPAEPSGTEPKSYQVTNYGGGPNTQCAGNSLFPVWVGQAAGKVVGDLTVRLHTISSGGTVDVRVWPDVNSTLCNSAATGTMEYVEPATSATVSLPPGHGALEVSLPNTQFTAKALMMIQITPVTVPPFFSRVLYDTADFASQIEFSCVPAAGAKSCAEG